VRVYRQLQQWANPVIGLEIVDRKAILNSTRKRAGYALPWLVYPIDELHVSMADPECSADGSSTYRCPIRNEQVTNDQDQAGGHLYPQLRFSAAHSAELKSTVYGGE
jgi:hypothetical protein